MHGKDIDALMRRWTEPPNWRRHSVVIKAMQEDAKLIPFYIIYIYRDISATYIYIYNVIYNVMICEHHQSILLNPVHFMKFAVPLFGKPQCDIAIRNLLTDSGHVICALRKRLLEICTACSCRGSMVHMAITSGVFPCWSERSSFIVVIGFLNPCISIEISMSGPCLSQRHCCVTIGGWWIMAVWQILRALQRCLPPSQDRLRVAPLHAWPGEPLHFMLMQLPASLVSLNVSLTFLTNIFHCETRMLLWCLGAPFLKQLLRDPDEVWQAF